MFLHYDDVGIVVISGAYDLAIDPERSPGSVEVVIPPESPDRQWVVRHVHDMLILIGPLAEPKRVLHELLTDDSNPLSAAQKVTVQPEANALTKLTLLVGSSTEITHL